MSNFYTLEFFLYYIAVFMASFMTCLFFIKIPIFKLFNDDINLRSLHKRPVPRIGGIAVLLSFFIAASFFDRINLHYLQAPLSILFFISLADDIFNVNFILRLITHFISAIIFIFFINVDILIYQSILLIFIIVSIINSFNFMDGADGMAGGSGFIIFLFYAFLAYLHNDINLFYISTTISISLLGFLFWNFNNAKIFLGDSGSITIGFLSSAIGIIGWQNNLWSFATILVMQIPFLLDTGFTLIRRIFKGEHIWEAHHEHFYQQLIINGWSHKKTSFVYYCAFLFNGSYLIFSEVILQNTDYHLIPLLLFNIFFGYLVSRKLSLLRKDI